MLKHMTATLLREFRSEDQQVSDRADEAWDKACDEYGVRLAQMRSRLPESVIAVLDGPCLHDAAVLGGARDQKQFAMLLGLKAPRRDQAVLLTYDLVTPPKKIVHEKLGGPRGRYILYDEFDIAADGIGFVHSILFTGGLELEVTFSTLDVRTLKISLEKKPEESFDFSEAGADLCDA
jgi:hypothetical protein